MKYYLLILILAIFLAYIDAEDKGKINSKTLEKMQNHIRKIRGLLRNLDTSDDEDDEISSDEVSSDDVGSGSEDEFPTNSTEPNPTSTPTSSPTSSPTSNPTSTPTSSPTSIPTTQKPVLRKYAAVQLLGFNSFVSPPTTPKITFKTFFAFINVRPARWVIIMIAINYRRGLRNLEEEAEPANCTIDDADKDKPDGICKYNCDAPKDTSATVEEVSVINITFQNSSLTMDDINYSEEAALQAAKLSKANDTTNEYIILQQGTYNIRNPYIFINGEIDGYDGNPGDTGLVLTVVDNSVTQKVPCEVYSKNGNNYQFRCTPESDVKGSILLQTIKDGDTAITLNMTNGNENLDFQYSNNPGNETSRNGAIYRKSSSGLSGGAIAGIVIACVVGLIIASIVAIMMKKTSATAPFQTQNPSIVGLRSVDNYSQQNIN